jgi:hypothetical protein
VAEEGVWTVGPSVQGGHDAVRKTVDVVDALFPAPILPTRILHGQDLDARCQ